MFFLRQNMEQLMDPSRNMSNYRNLLSLQLQQSPAVSVRLLFRTTRGNLLLVRVCV